MKRIGITGGIGSGKSIIGKILSILDFPVFYSDYEAKQIMLKDKNVMTQLENEFGDEAYIEGELNRDYLAQQIFSHPELKSKINAIVHPAVRNAFDEFSRKSDKPLVFNEAAILFETGSYKNFDANILVFADEDLRVRRVMDRDQVPESLVGDRIKNQWLDEQKIPMADYVIKNNEDSLLVPQVEKIISDLIKG